MIGRASASTGAARANATATLATPRIEMMPSAMPRKCAPESPMKMRAGWKLKIRNPAQQPARAPLSCTTSGCLSCPAANMRITATMAMTPAANPSTPSRKLTVFCMLTSQKTLTGAISHPSAIR